jgi:hypothetical protein
VDREATVNLVHESWCNVNASDDARGSMSVDRTTCDCGAERRHDGLWQPHRDAATEVGAGFKKFLERLKLDTFTDSVHHTFFIRGQDGWAFGAAVRFQSIAHSLANGNEQYYWSGYHLLALIIERARKDLVLLEAIEALAIAHVHGNLSESNAGTQLKQMGVWP